MAADKKSEFSHINQAGNPSMVDVGDKKVTFREARARSIVQLDKKIMEAFRQDEIHTKKGPVIQTAIIAGTMAAKNTGNLIPLCHPLPLEKCQFEVEVIEAENKVIIDCITAIHAKTGVEMEALTGASIAALTIYDMCKGLSQDIVIRETRLIQKTGGKNDFRRTPEAR